MKRSCWPKGVWKKEKESSKAEGAGRHTHSIRMRERRRGRESAPGDGKLIAWRWHAKTERAKGSWMFNKSPSPETMACARIYSHISIREIPIVFYLPSPFLFRLIALVTSSMNRNSIKFFTVSSTVCRQQLNNAIHLSQQLNAILPSAEDCPAPPPPSPSAVQHRQRNNNGSASENGRLPLISSLHSGKNINNPNRH